MITMMMMMTEEECVGMEALATKTSQISFYCSSQTLFKACFYCLRFNLSDAPRAEYAFQNKSDSAKVSEENADVTRR